MTRTSVARWRERCAAQLGTPEEAVSIVEDGDTIYAGTWTSVPVSLCEALAKRAGILRGITVTTALAPFNWDRPEILEHYRIRTCYAGVHDRQAVRAGRIEYVPAAQWREGVLPLAFGDPLDAAMVPISPPDADGYCSFGGAVWFGPTVCSHAKKLIGEVHPDFIRTAGQNAVHVSCFARLTECTTAPPPPPVAPRSEEPEVAAQVTCVLVASEDVCDRCKRQSRPGERPRG